MAATVDADLLDWFPPGLREADVGQRQQACPSHELGRPRWCPQGDVAERRSEYFIIGLVGRSPYDTLRPLEHSQIELEVAGELTPGIAFALCHPVWPRQSL